MPILSTEERFLTYVEESILFLTERRRASTKGEHKARQKTHMTNDKKRQVTALLDSKDNCRFSAYCEDRGSRKSPLIVRPIRDHLDRGNFQSQGKLFTEQSQHRQ